MEPVELAGRLRDALEAASYDVASVEQRLGPRAVAALARNETTPGRSTTSRGDALDTLVRLFLLQLPVPLVRAEGALPGLVDPLCVHGVLEQSVGEVAARLDVRPYQADERTLWVMSDLTPGLDGTPLRVAADHVLGISSASTSLAQLTLRSPAGSALDLGTGCGVQALHLAAHVDLVVATDVNPRALWMTGFNLALNDLPAGRVQVRDGSFFEPVAGEAFDLIATNPPFVISPATSERLVYRDSGLPGDRAVEDIVRAAPSHLRPGGWCQVLANWVIARDHAWDERLASWLDPSCDALVVQREVIDPAAYVELWLKDAGLHGGASYVERYDTWLRWFDEQGVEGVGFGWINLRRTDLAPRHDLLSWPYEVEQPIAPAIEAWGTAVATPLSDAELSAAHLVLAADVGQEALGVPGAEDPETIVLRQQRGFRRARTADTATAALVGACDGDLSVGQILAALATLLGRDGADLAAESLPVVRELLREGFLLYS